MQKNKQAFTLVELLVVVLIIGVLSAIAIPMYQGAVDKSHWSTMLPGAKAIKDAEEAIKMTNGAYTDEMANLDVTMNNADLTFALLTPNNTADPNVIRVTNSKLANVRLASYLDDNPKFAGQLHCEALKNDERANRLCGKLLMGQELTEQDGYIGYLLDQEIDKATCKDANRAWSSNLSACYKTTKDRCDAGEGSYSGGVCTYNKRDDIVIEDGEICQPSLGWSANPGCKNITVNEGGVCDASTVPSGGCTDSTFNSGSVCKSGGNYYSCTGTFDNAKAENCTYSNCKGTFINGSTCEGNSAHSCKGTFTSGSQCIADSAYACMDTTFEGDNTVCIAKSGYLACNGTFSNGAICVANAESSCFYSNFDEGGICIANVGNTCRNVGGNGCCCGKSCPTNKKCADSVCNRADVAKYIQVE